MSHFVRMQLVGRVTYYLGWLALLAGGLAHFKNGLFDAMSLSKRNLFEVSVMCFLICVASELRARDSAGAEESNLVKRQAVA